MYSSKKLEFNDSRLDVRKGGGSRYRESVILLDLTAEETKACKCHTCRDLA